MNNDAPSSVPNETFSVPGIAFAMGVSVPHLEWLAREVAVMYYEQEIPKRKGGTRLVYEPKPVLRRAQSWILANVLDRIEPTEWAVAYGKGASTLKAVSPHAGNNTLVRLDLEDFFGHIKPEDVFHVFKECGCNASAAYLLTALCTSSNGTGASTPQGAVTSPRISNLAMVQFDEDVSSAVRGFLGIYTRYADDILISTPSSLGQSTLARLVETVDRVAGRYGQLLNRSKTHVMVGTERKSALGLTIGTEISMYRRARRNFRAMCFQFEQVNAGLQDGPLPPHAASLFNQCRGMHAYMTMVDPIHAAKFAERYEWLKTR